MRHWLWIVLLFFFSCSEPARRLPYADDYFQSLSGLEKEEFRSAYKTIRSNAESKRKKWKNEYASPANRKKIIKKARDYFYHTLTDSLFPFWYGTHWDFNGITQNPREGNIACGYFVTTTLTHYGFKLDRSQLAQQPAATIIKTVCKKNSIKTFSNGNVKGLVKYMKAKDNGLYVIGLDNHVGFVDKRDTAVYMIHSSGLRPFEVTIERLEESRAILRSKLHMIGSITANDDIFVKWVGGEKVVMVE